MKPFVLLIGLCFLMVAAKAQKPAEPGYIVKISGDTLRGMLRVGNGDELAKQISFRDTVSGRDFTVYTPEQVVSFGFANGYQYRVIRFKDDRPKEGSVQRAVYGKLLVTGEDDLYSFSEDGILYFLARKGGNFLLIYDDDLRTMPYVKGNFRNELNFFASNCETAGKAVEQTGYSEAGVMAFFEQLDACLNPNLPVRSYYHPVKGQSGFFTYIGEIGYGTRSQFTLEAYWRRSWPQVDPHLSVNIGLRFASLVKRAQDTVGVWHDMNFQIRSVPVTVQYNLVWGPVQAFAYAGFSLATVNINTDLPEFPKDVYYHSYALALVMGAGVQVKVTRRLFARAEWRTEYMSQFPTAGVAVILP
ncbi:MAG TPA: hypothetical protein VN616_16785 [Puia sp.]|nr:hypothetical protein [Puia sp.]